MTRMTMTSIVRICPACQAPNTVIAVTTEFRPHWKMNCSRCGSPIPESDESEPPVAERGGPAAFAEAPPPARPARPETAGRREGRGGRARRLRAACRRCTGFNMAIGAACGAFVTALLLEAGGDGADRPDRYQVVVTAAIGPDALPARLEREHAEPLFEHARAPADVTAGDDQRLAKAAREDSRARVPAMLRRPTAGAERPPGAFDVPRASGGYYVTSAEPPVVLAGAERHAAEASEAPPDPRAAAAAEAGLGLTRGERREVQRRLRLASHDPKLVDGIFGPATRAAIGAWQEASGLPVTGFLDGDALALLGRQTESEYRTWRAAERARVRKRQLAESARLESPVPVASPAGGACQRGWTGEIAYGQNMRCDFRGLREELLGVRNNVVELFRGAESS